MAVLYPKDSKTPTARLSRISKPPATIYLLELINGHDNRLTQQSITTIHDVLDDIEKEWRLARTVSDKGKTTTPVPAALVTCGPTDHHRFYSNGLDFERALALPSFFSDYLDPFLRRFLFFPIPTFAAINGHAFAGGMGLAMCHDYRIMKAVPGDGKGRAQMCMNEIDFGAVLPPGIAQVLKLKIPSPNVLRDTVLLARRWSANDALHAGLVDYLEPTGPDVIEKAVALAQEAAIKAAKIGLAGMKDVLYKDVVPGLSIPDQGIAAFVTPKDENTIALRRLNAKL